MYEYAMDDRHNRLEEYRETCQLENMEKDTNMGYNNSREVVLVGMIKKRKLVWIAKNKSTPLSVFRAEKEVEQSRDINMEWQKLLDTDILL
jgi:hypothetical protein